MFTLTIEPNGPAATPARTNDSRAAARQRGTISVAQLVAALPRTFRQLDTRQLWRNPVLFIVEVGALLTSALAIAEPFLGGPATSGGDTVPPSFTAGIAGWL
jgi:K+-transporting ATPase ATPase B chain